MTDPLAWSITVLEYARAPECPAFVMAYGALGVRPLPYSITVLETDDHTVLVDTGYEDVGYAHELGRIDGVTTWSPPIDVLARAGVRAEDVDTILLTHAHYDHLGNIERFPNAIAWIQARELERWRWALDLPDRLSWLKDGVDGAHLDAASRLLATGRLRLIDGPLDAVLPGVRLVPDFDTHTFGHQHVEVDDAVTGRWVLPGDAAYSYENFGGLDGRGRLTPIGYATGSQENSLFALDRMLEAVDGDRRRIVPGHEIAVFEQFPSYRFADGLMGARVLVRPGDLQPWPATPDQGNTVSARA
jgi:glyoxylase-like metal-dependent hydrolase (beta-lactamase superfamily II)